MRKVFSHSKQDEYYTPRYAVKPILAYAKKFERIWCPFDTSGSNYVRMLRELNIDVVCTHIENGNDFFNTEIPNGADAVISNPPFSLKQDVLKRCIEIGLPFCLLLPFTMFNSIQTVRATSKGVQFLIMDRRISFNGKRPNFTCWYVGRAFFPQDVQFHLFEDDPRRLYANEQKTKF